MESWYTYILCRVYEGWQVRFDRFISVLLCSYLAQYVPPVNGHCSVDIKGFRLDLGSFFSLLRGPLSSRSLHSVFLRSGQTSIACTKPLKSRSAAVPASTNIDRDTYVNQFKPSRLYRKIHFRVNDAYIVVILIKIKIVPIVCSLLIPNLLRPLIRQRSPLLFHVFLFIL